MINQRTILTQKQKETLDFINDFVGRTGNAPTIDEMRQELNLRSLRSVTQRLEALERKGFIKRNRFQHRGITVLEHMDPFAPGGTMRIPVIASAGADTLQIYAQEQYGEYLTVENNIIPDLQKEIVAIKVVGNSMVDAGLSNGDYVLVEVGEHPENGDLVVAIVGDMAVVKKIQFVDGAVILKPESKNKMYQPIVLSDTSKVFGKVLRTIKMRTNHEEYTYEPIPGSP